LLYKFALTAFCERLLQVKLHAHATAAASQPGTVAGSGSTLRCEMQHSDLVADSVRHRLGGARGRQDLSLSRPDATHCPHLSVRYLHRGADVAVQRHACVNRRIRHTHTYVQTAREVRNKATLLSRPGSPSQVDAQATGALRLSQAYSAGPAQTVC
jgi:hypothetical protein